MKKEWKEAIQRDDVERLGRLLNSETDINMRDRYGQTALMIAARDGRSSAVRFLVANGAALDHTAKYGLSAVMLAVINGHVDTVRILAEAGADLEIRGTGAPGFEGKTAVDLATAQSRFDMVEILRKGRK